MTYFVSLSSSYLFLLLDQYSLQLKRSLAGSHRSSPLLSRLIRVTIQSGLVCSSTAIIALILSLLNHGTDFMVPIFMLTKLYSINLLAILNSRMQILGGRVYGPVGDPESRSLSFLTRGPDVTLTPFGDGGEQNHRGPADQHSERPELARDNVYLPMTGLRTADTSRSVWPLLS